MYYAIAAGCLRREQRLVASSVLVFLVFILFVYAKMRYLCTHLCVFMPTNPFTYR